MSSSVKTIVLLVIVAVVGVVIYRQVRWYTTGQQRARQETKDTFDRNVALRGTQTLREEGKQQFGRFMVEAKHVAGLEFADVTIRETKGDTVTQEIKAGGMTIKYANEAITSADLSGLTISDYDEDGTASTSTRDSALMIFINSARGPTGVWREGQVDAGDPGIGE